MDFSSILIKKKVFDIIKYTKNKGPLYFILLWTIYQSYHCSKGIIINQFFKLLRFFPTVNNQIEHFKKEMNNTFQQSQLTLYKIPDEGLNELKYLVLLKVYLRVNRIGNLVKYLELFMMEIVFYQILLIKQ